MNIKIENIGKIKSANIKFDGLTVIAGENDTGKSTVGKLLFAIIKALSKYENKIIEKKEKLIYKKIKDLYQNIIRYDLGIFLDTFQSLFFPNIFYNELKQIIKEKDFFKLDKTLDKRSSFLINFFKIYVENGGVLIDLIIELEDIKEKILNQEDKKILIWKSLTQILYSEFYFEISPKNNNEKSLINLENLKKNILEIEIEENKIIDLKVDDNLFLFDDATFVETPLFMQMYDLIKRANILFDKQEYENSSRVSLHIKDLINKLEKASNFIDFGDENELLNNISEIIEGKFKFDYDNNDFIFSKKGKRIKTINTASGIKSFGIIQLLLQAEILDNNNLLIIDEPENHLHPEWQVKYAKIIIKLVENGIPVILSSHSPYMIQALKHFSDKSKISKRTNFYFAENKEDGSEIIDVTNNLNIIFQKLAEPLNKLIWKQ